MCVWQWAREYKPSVRIRLHIRDTSEWLMDSRLVRRAKMHLVGVRFGVCVFHVDHLDALLGRAGYETRRAVYKP